MDAHSSLMVSLLAFLLKYGYDCIYCERLFDHEKQLFRSFYQLVCNIMYITVEFYSLCNEFLCKTSEVRQISSNIFS